MFILVNDMSSKAEPNYIWYICDLKYYENPNSTWILEPTESLKRKNAMQFCETKAKLLAEILSNQTDEEGYSSRWIVEPV